MKLEKIIKETQLYFTVILFLQFSLKVLRFLLTEYLRNAKGANTI